MHIISQVKFYNLITTVYYAQLFSKAKTNRKQSSISYFTYLNVRNLNSVISQRSLKSLCRKSKYIHREMR